MMVNEARASIAASAPLGALSVRLFFGCVMLLLSVPALARGDEPVLSSHFADFSGTRVHFTAAGQGAHALIFVHGWAGSAEIWTQSTNAFPEYRVIAVDLPGHGQSDKPRTDYTMDYFARSIEVVMRAAGVRKAVLVGHSMGTPVIRQFYRLYPEQVLGLIIVDGSLRAPLPKEAMEDSIAPFRVSYLEKAEEAVERMIQPIQDRQLKQRIRAIMLATPDYIGLSAMNAMAEERIWAEEKIDVPVLAILAESPWWPPDTETFYRSIAPHLDFRVWRDASHFLMMEKPGAFNEAVRRFVSSNGLLQDPRQ